MLEEKLERLTKALEENTAVQKAVLDTLQGKTAKASAPDTAKKEEPKAEPKKAEAKKSEKASKKAATLDDIRETFGAFLGVDDEDVRKARKDFVKAMLAHFYVEKAAEISEDDRALAIRWVKEKTAGKKVNFQDETESSDEEDMLG